MPQISALPLQPLSLNPPPTLSILLQGRVRPLILPSVARALYPLLHALSLWQGVPPLLTSNITAPLAQLSALNLQQGGPHLQPSAVNTPPQISAFLPQQDVLPLLPSAMRADATPPSTLSVSLQG